MGVAVVSASCSFPCSSDLSVSPLYHLLLPVTLDFAKTYLQILSCLFASVPPPSPILTLTERLSINFSSLLVWWSWVVMFLCPRVTRPSRNTAHFTLPYLTSRYLPTLRNVHLGDLYPLNLPQDSVFVVLARSARTVKGAFW